MAISYVGSGQNASNSTTISYTMASNTNFVLLSMFTSVGGGDPYIVTAKTNNGGSLLPIYGAINNTNNKQVSGVSYYVSGWYYVPLTDSTAPTSFTFTFNGGTPGTVTIKIVEYSGVSTTPLAVATPNVNSQTNPGAATDAVTSLSTTVTVGAIPLALVGVSFQIAGGTGGSNMSAGTGYTLRYGTNYGFIEDISVSSSGSYAATFTDTTGAGDTTATFVVALNPATAPFITSQPTNQNGLIGSTATFSVTALSSTFAATQVIDFGSATSGTSIQTGSYILNMGDRVLLWAMGVGTSDTTTGCTDTSSNTWNKVSSSFYTTGGCFYVAWECKNITIAGATQVTVALSSSSSQRGIAGIVFSGLSSTAAVQAVASNVQSGQGTSANAITTGNLTPTSQPSVIVGLIQAQAATVTINAGTGFAGYTLSSVSAFNGGSSTTIEYKRLTSTTPVPATATTTSSTAFNFVSLAAIITSIDMTYQWYKATF